MGAVIFDMDGVLLDSEQVWDEVRQRLVEERGGRWHARAQRDMMGMSSQEWPVYMRDRLDLAMTPRQIFAAVSDGLRRRYLADLPLIPGAAEAVRQAARRGPLGLASSSPAEVIELALRAAGLREHVTVVLSSEEVGRGKPAPDVYLEVAARLGVAPGACTAVEDSTNGIRAALAAGMRVVAVPNPHYPPDPEVLGRAHAVVDSVVLVPAAL